LIGQQRRSNSLSVQQNSLAVLQLLMGIVTLGFDVWALIHDSFSGFANGLKWVEDLLGTLGDLGNVASGLASLFNIGWLKPIADGIGAITNFLSGVYKIAENSWVGLWLLQGAVITVKAMFSEADIVGFAVSSTLDIATSRLGVDIQSAAKSVILDVVQGAMSAGQWKLDRMTSENIQQYCNGTCQ